MKLTIAVMGLVCITVFTGFGQCVFQPYDMPGGYATYGSPVDEKVVWFAIWKDAGHACVCMTSDGGLTWNHGSIDAAPSTYRITGISAIDATTAWVSMYDQSGQTSGGIFRTRDGGKTWEHQATAFHGSGGWPNDVHFFDEDLGLCFGDPNGGFFEIYKTKDGGERWIRVQRTRIPDPIIYEVGFDNRSASCGDCYWFGTDSPGGGRVFRTTDRGESWSVSEQLRQHSPAMAFQNGEEGIASAEDGTLLRTADGGKTWSVLPPPEHLLPGAKFPTHVPGTQSTYVLPGVALIGRDTVTVLAFSTDAGSTWRMMERLSSPYFYQYSSDNITGVVASLVAPAFASAQCGWMGAPSGVLHWPGYSGGHLWRTTPSIRFLTWRAGIQTPEATISIGNYGTEALTVRHLILSGDNFRVVNPPSTPFDLSPWEAINLDVVFSPLEGGSSGDYLEIYSDAINGPELTVKLTGTTMMSGRVSVGAEMIAASTSLYRVSEDGAASAVCDLGVGMIEELAVDPTTKTLYGIVTSGSSSTLLYIDPRFPGALPAVTIPVGDIRAIAFSADGTLYGGTGKGDLLRINHTTGAARLLGSTPGLVYSSFSFSPSGELYASVTPPLANKDAIYVVDKKEGRATLVGKTGDNVATASIAFNARGVLYGLKGTGSRQNTIIRINPATGAGTNVGSTGASGLKAVALIDIQTYPHTKRLPSLTKQSSGELPAVLELHQNYPNPFNPSTSIAFALPKESHVVLSVYNMLGQEVATLLDETMDAGSHTVTFDASSMSSGVLFYRITAGEYRETKRMVFMK